MDWSKTRKVKVNVLNNSKPIYLRTFSRDRLLDAGIHALFALQEKTDRVVTIVGSREDIEELKPRVDGIKVRLMNFQKANHAKHMGLLLMIEPEGQADMRRMFDLVERIKPDTVGYQTVGGSND